MVYNTNKELLHVTTLIKITYYLSGSSGNLCCFRSSLPLITGADNPGHSILILPTPIIWPLFKSRILIRPVPLPRPFLAPALLTDVTDFHNLSAGTVRKEKSTLIFYIQKTIFYLLMLIYLNFRSLNLWA